MSRYIISPQARQDLLQIRDYIAGDSVEAARRVLATLRSSLARLPDGCPIIGKVARLPARAAGERLTRETAGPEPGVHRAAETAERARGIFKIRVRAPACAVDLSPVGRRRVHR